MKNIVTTVKIWISKISGKEIHSEEIETAVTSTYRYLIDASGMTPNEVMSEYATSKSGLTNLEAEKRLIKFGNNQVAHEKSLPWYRQFLKTFLDPFIGVLIILGIASFITEFLLAAPEDQSIISVVIIGILVLISVILAFVQEYQASQAADQLLLLVRNKTIVYREEAGRQELLTEEIVPGDIIHLSAGDIIPADVRLFDITNMSVNEAALTGESLPVEKFDWLIDQSIHSTRPVENITDINPLDFDNIGYQGTNVVSGSSKAIVLTTGINSYLGAMSEHLVGHHPPSSFDKGVKSVSLLLIRLMMVMVPIIFVINGFARGDWLQALLFGLAVAVGLTPEMLPTIVTANLAKGSIELARQKTVVKRLNAIQNLGAMDVLCTDKTGTLTEDEVALEKYININGKQDQFVLKYTYLNSYFQSGFRNPLDDAVLSHADSDRYSGINFDHSKIGEIPFETARRRMSVIVKDESNQHLLICKGALDEMLSIASHIKIDDQQQPLTADLEHKIRSLVEANINDGLRVLLVAYKPIDTQRDSFTVEDENNLILIGMIGFLDPPKESAGEAIKALLDKGIQVIVITGDNEIATRRVCREIDFNITGLIDGNQIEQMNDQELNDVIKASNVFVRAAPLQKSRILNTIKEMGHTVGFLGDGINDAIALRDADVGISVDNAVDIAKESADILLLEKSLIVLEEGVTGGRHVFGNIMKYIKMTISSNFGNVFSVLVASIILPFPPMLPLHLLIQNLLYDISQISIPWDNVDDSYLKQPRKWDPTSIARFAIIIGPVSSLFDFTTFALLWFIIGANSLEKQSLFHSGWFVLGLLSQTFIVHLIRTHKKPFIHSNASVPVYIMTTVIMIIGVVIPFTPLGANIGFQPLPWTYFPLLFLTILGYALLVESIKTRYIKRFKEWL
jgi:Mg2+-importing ATPase